MLERLVKYCTATLAGAVLLGNSCSQHSVSVDGKASLPSFEGEPSVYYSGELPDPFKGISYVTLQKNDANCHIYASPKEEGERKVFFYGADSGDCGDVTKYMAFDATGRLDEQVTPVELHAKTTETTKAIRATGSHIEEQVNAVFN